MKPFVSRAALFPLALYFRVRVSSGLPLSNGRLRQRLLLIAFLLPSVVFGLNCGKRRPPLPPVERVQQRTELLSGVQRGNQVILSWPVPLRNAKDESVQSIPH